jgi:thiosulfate sulfurtransferase
MSGPQGDKAVSQFHYIDIDQAKEHLDAGTAVFLDIRDEQARQQGHIEGSIHLTDENAESFLTSSEKKHPVVVYCYHGNSSQMAAQYLVEHGFAEVYSMDGGFEGWACRHPFRTGPTATE